MKQSPKPVRIPDLLEQKQRGEKITVLTAYDATMARLLDCAGIDLILVGDSLGMVIMGHETTLEVTLDMMVHHTRAVRNGTRHALVIADMPFMTFQTSLADAVRNAGRLIQEGGAAAVKVEGGRASSEVTARLVEIGIPVMGHIGLTPQSVHQLGGFKRVKGAAAEKLLEEARIVEQAGAFAIVLESIPSEIAREITQALTIPTIGIGAGPHCDGQVLVSYDALGLFDEFTPSFVKRYAELGKEVVRSAREYIDDVRSGRFPQ
ncbi:MAG: 3-methyl-2-oxobutanoatehydroxymethyltransferase [Bryobacterales bacterium]|nr:3-methyl-2-oxobutanoatehydroxymethyltransferase [Bryobacterales bacterium]